MRSLLGSPRIPAIIGEIEGLVGDALQGWAMLVRAPEIRLSIGYDRGEGFRALARADRYRADLERAGRGDGHLGFLLPPLSPGADVMAVGGGECATLSWNRDGFRRSQPPRAGREGSLSFALDAQHIDGWRVSGWALDRSEPTRRVIVELRSGGTTLAGSRASLFRPELAEAGEDPYRGFALSTSTRPVDLVEAGTGRRLARIGR